MLSTLSPRLFFSLKTTAKPRVIHPIFRKMSTMKAVLVEEQGPIENMLYKDVAIPKATGKNIVVKNRFAGVNYIDTYQRSGLYKVQTPYILGREASGDVVEVGDEVTGFKVGDRVVYLGGSTYAEYTSVDEAAVEVLDEKISYENGAALGINALTAWTMIRDAYPVKKGDNILVHAAAGGVGLVLTQMIRYLGANVIGTVSTEEKAKLARENGCNEVIIYTKEDLVERVNQITNNLGCEAVLDGVGKDTFEKSIACTRRLGTMISFGNASGAVPPTPITVLTPKNLKLMRPQLFGYMVTREESRKWWNEVFDLVEKKVIKLNIHKIYDLKDAQQAHTDIESRGTTGKLLIKF